jgi:Cys-rich protein (TIGR01571 family)
MIPLIHTSHRAQLRTREEVRERYGIRGAAFGDCLTLWCCRPCALTQERREIELEESSFGK